MVIPALRQAVDRLPSSMRGISGYHFGWWDREGAPIMAEPGKNVRPALVLLACEAVGGTWSQGLPAAVAVELVHNASLVQDDILDADRLRRHRPTVWSAFGVAAGILAGDALFFLATQVLCDAGPPLGSVGLTWLNRAVQEMIDGQYADVVLSKRVRISLSECQVMAGAKTGALLGAACALGGVAAGGDPESVEHLRWFGHHLGMAFQLVDDLLGIWGDSQRTGKPCWSDLRTRKKSLPVAAALTAQSPPAWELASLYHRPGPLSEDELHHVAALIESAGGRRWADEQTQRHLHTAMAHLRGVKAAPAAGGALTALAHLICARDH